MTTSTSADIFPGAWDMTPGDQRPDRFTGHRPWDADDGYDFMHSHAEPAGWRAVSGWGKNGWDLGDWPYVVMYHRKESGAFWFLQYTEGDLIAYRFGTLADLHAHTDGAARFYWDHDRDRGPADLDSPDARGPFSWARLGRVAPVRPPVTP